MVSRANTKCHICEKLFHYCGSCGRDGYSEDGYCSYTCKKSKVKELISKVEEFISKENLLKLMDLMERHEINLWDIQEQLQIDNGTHWILNKLDEGEEDAS